MFGDNTSKYADIIDLPRPISKHKPMSIHDRAAQFSSFSALTGLDDELAETARITYSMIEISEDRAARLDEKLWILIANASAQPEIEVEYFVPDEMKEGGAYITVKERFKRVDDETNNLILMDGTVIPAERIYSISGEIFDNSMTDRE